MSWKNGASLIEVVVAVSVMGAASVMYATGWSLHRGQTDAAREIEIATELYLRQVEQIKRQDPKNRNQSPFAETAFQEADACPPDFPNVAPGNYPNSGRTFYRTLGTAPTNQLHPAQPHSVLLLDGINGRTPQNAFRITPANDVPGNPWLIQIPPQIGNSVATGGMGFSVSVCCARIHNFIPPLAAPTLAQLNDDGAGAIPPSYEHQMIKYCVRVDRDPGDGVVKNLLTHEFIVEVR